MLTSVRWLNDYLDPPASDEEQADLATRAGFPLEGRETIPLPDGGDDCRQDFEMTSNRGDCVCHVGLAREIAAISGRTLKVPPADPPRGSARAADVVRVTNHEPGRCPLYTARIIRGATIGPSPAWLAERLIARGDIPRNNVVDATNFVLFELGQPTHVFDLATLAGPEIIVRNAHAEEPFLPIGEGETEVALSTDDLVIADAKRAVAIAGVKGGALTAVSERTTDLLLEAATFDPVAVRNTSRRLGIASDSSYRFERGVHPAQIAAAADRLAALILETAGGELLDGVVQDGAAVPGRRTVSMRPERCRAVLGLPIPDEQMMDALARLGFEPTRTGDRIACTAPVFRLDVEREVDLIEEVGRMFGHDNIPIDDAIRIQVAPPQPREMARQAVAGTLVGLGFVETVTHSLLTDEAAAPFLEPGEGTIRVEDDRAKATPALQPSVLPGLLRVRKHNLDHGVERLRLFESAAVFRDRADGPHREAVMLGLVMDVENAADGLRPLRGVIERLIELLAGPDVRVAVAAAPDIAWLEPGATASVDGTVIGRYGRLAAGVARGFGLDDAPLVAELDLVAFYETFPPETGARRLPSVPAIERDLSIIVDEAVTWARVTEVVDGLDLDHLEATSFVTTFRGKQIPTGRKSVTLRLRFRAADRTLRHEEVDPQMTAAVAALGDALAAEVRQ